MSFPLRTIGILKSKGGGIPRNGLIGEWLFSGDANDTSGNGNDGVITGALLSNGKDGGANSSYGFGGTVGTSTSDNINVGDSTPLVDIPNSDFSISVWAYDLFSSVTNLSTIWSSWKSGNYGVLIRTLGIVGDTNRAIRFEVFYTTTAMKFESDRLVPNSTWTNIVVTFDNSTKTAKIYIDGVEATYAATITGVGTLKSDSGTNKIIGKLGTLTLQTWNGYSSLLRIYNRILTSPEITIMANE